MDGARCPQNNHHRNKPQNTGRDSGYCFVFNREAYEFFLGGHVSFFTAKEDEMREKKLGLWLHFGTTEGTLKS